MSRKREDDPRATLAQSPPMTRGQLQSLALASLGLMRRAWRLSENNSPVEPKMAMLLMKVYLRELTGKPISKKEAWQSLGVEDARTGRKYTSQAEKLGLIEVVRSAEDKRKELLFPTSKLQDVVEKELGQFSRELEYYYTSLHSAEDSTITTSMQKRQSARAKSGLKVEGELVKLSTPFRMSKVIRPKK